MKIKQTSNKRIKGKTLVDNNIISTSVGTDSLMLRVWDGLYTFEIVLSKNEIENIISSSTKACLI